MRNGEFVEAEKLLGEALRLETKDPCEVGPAAYYIAYCRAKRGDRAGAKESMREADEANWHRFAFNAAIRIAQREAESAIGP